jgi:hypothetical protein
LLTGILAALEGSGASTGGSAAEGLTCVAVILAIGFGLHLLWEVGLAQMARALRAIRKSRRKQWMRAAKMDGGTGVFPDEEEGDGPARAPADPP